MYCLLKLLIYLTLACQIELLELKKLLWFFHMPIFQKRIFCLSLPRECSSTDKPVPSTTKFYHFSRIGIMIWGKTWQVLIDNRNHASLLKWKTH